MADSLALLCDRADDTGGAERYWATVVPALIARHVPVQLIAREIGSAPPFGITATEVRWAADDAPPSAAAAERVRTLLVRANARTVVTAGVFDAHVLHAVRAVARRWVVRIHDHRAFCAHGDRVFAQFDGICTQPIGTGCAINALVHGCMHGAHRATLTRLAGRLAARDEIVRADAVLVSSAHMRDTAVRNGVPPERVHITPPPLADNAYCLLPAAPPRRPTILFAARLTPAKGLRSLIRALARIDRRTRPLLIVAGRGADEERQARALAAARRVEIVWAGWLSPQGMRDAIDASSAVCIPSLWPEPFGLVGIEAQARGRPTVAYDVGGIGEWIGAGGITVARGDERALARALEAIVNPFSWRERSLLARSLADRYRLCAHMDALAPHLGCYTAVSSSSAVGAINGSASRAESAGASGNGSASSYGR